MGPGTKIGSWKAGAGQPEAAREPDGDETGGPPRDLCCLSCAVLLGEDGVKIIITEPLTLASVGISALLSLWSKAGMAALFLETCICA